MKKKDPSQLNNNNGTLKTWQLDSGYKKPNQTLNGSLLLSLWSLLSPSHCSLPSLDNFGFVVCLCLHLCSKFLYIYNFSE